MTQQQPPRSRARTWLDQRWLRLRSGGGRAVRFAAALPGAARQRLARRQAPVQAAAPFSGSGPGQARLPLSPATESTESAATTPRSTRPLARRSGAVLARLPLPVTTLVLTLLVLVPALLLWRLPRPRAVGLEQLLDDVSLLQSFPPSPDRPVPALWRERLGSQAQLIWRRQRGPWWQLWSDHTDSPPLLAIGAGALPGGLAATLPANALRVGDLVVIAPDPLSRQLLRDRLLPQQRLSRGLNRRCLERLRQDQAVLWSSTGMGVISGPMAPLLQRFSRGCLSLSLGDGGLLWQGEAGDREGLYAASGQAPPPPPLPPLPADRLLEIDMGQADLLLQGLLARPLIRDPLTSRYGLDGPRLTLLRRTPLRLRLRPLRQGPFQAGLELQLPVGRQVGPWRTLLDKLSRSLVEQGLNPLGPSQAAGTAAATAAGQAGISATGASSQPQPDAGALASGNSSLQGVTWRRSDGVVVGGWRWIRPAGGLAQLLFFLGPPPREPLLSLPRGGRQLVADAELRLRARPAALAALGLLPADLPVLVRRADQLWMVAQTPQGKEPGTPLSRLAGGLRLPR